MTTRALATLVALYSIVLPAAQAATVTYTDFASWSSAVSGITTIDFESPVAPAGGTVEIAGNEYAGLGGAPELQWTPSPGPNDDQRLLVGPQRVEVGPSSGSQLAFPGLFTSSDGNGGVVRLTTAAPMFAGGAFFADIEGGATSTGFDLDLDGVIDVLFSNAYPINPADGETVFLGFTSNLPVASFDVHINSTNSSGAGEDGVGFDDLSFSLVPVPVPAAAWLFGSALVFLGWLRRRA